MRSRGWGWVLVTVILGGLLAWRSTYGARELRYYAPDEYVERADAFIRASYLVADCRGPEPQLVPRLEEASPRDQSWYRDSYLARDVARFNADPSGFGWAFAVDADCRLRGVNPVVHAVELPFHHGVRWLGSILWRGDGADATLRSAARTITLRRPEGPVPADESATTEVGATTPVLKEGVVLLHYPGGRGQPAARLFHVGDQVVVHNRGRGADEMTRLLGHTLKEGRMARLETGDWLHLASRKRYTRAEETFVFLGGEAREVASMVRRQNARFARRSDDGGLGRVIDPTRDTGYPYLDLVAKSISSVLRFLPEERAQALVDQFDVQLTLDREIQRVVSDRFGVFCRDQERVARLDRPLSAGMTIMDGQSGDLLALATYPTAGDLSADTEGRGRLLRNQNFALHPIGSAGKPFFFAAVAEAVPALRSLTIDEHAPERYHPDIFQCQLPLGYQLLEGHYGAIDFIGALEMSCNKYTMELVTLALAADRARSLGASTTIVEDPDIAWPLAGRTTAASIGGRPLTGAPDLGGFVFQDGAVVARPRSSDAPRSGAAIRCSSLDRLDQASWSAPLARITGAAVYRGEAPVGVSDEASARVLDLAYATNRFDLESWQPLLAALLEGADETESWRIRAALQPIAPDRVNLALNQVTRLRADYVSLLLGGGTSVWTNVQLAEATARLVTGRAVRARLASEVVPRHPVTPAPSATPLADAALAAANGAAPLDIRPESREPVLAGMRRVVVGARGTARALRDELKALQQAFPSDTIALYAKTGSPITERLVPAATGAALEALVARGRLIVEGRRLSVRVGNSIVAYAAPRAAGRDAFRQALRSALREIGTGASRAVRGVIARVVDGLADELADTRVALDEIIGPIRVDAGGLSLDREDRLFRSRRIKGKAGVLLFAVVRVPGRRLSTVTPADLAAADTRVLSVALHLDADQNSEIAVQAAEVMLPLLEPLLR